MEFKVFFKAGTYYRSVDISSKLTGIETLDEIRKDLEAPELPLSKVVGTIGGINTNPTIVITESQARRAGLFAQTGEVAVETKRGGLNKFCYESFSVEKDGQGSIQLVRPIYRLDEEAVIGAWLDAGCPLEWEIE